MTTIGCQKGQEELVERTASLQLLLFQNPTPMFVITDHLNHMVKLLAGPEAIWIGSSVAAASQVNPLSLHLVSFEGTVV